MLLNACNCLGGAYASIFGKLGSLRILRGGDKGWDDELHIKARPG
jgi:hypothetical protein